MQRMNEHDSEFRNGDWGVKYFMRGPKIDWGVILLKPGQSMGEHGHAEVEETFYCEEGNPTLILDGKDIPARQGDVFRLEPPERHDFRNDGGSPARIIFIKTPYLPEDKI
jgi:quercetin dioxygenase-like cupin family protein